MVYPRYSIHPIWTYGKALKILSSCCTLAVENTKPLGELLKLKIRFILWFRISRYLAFWETKGLRILSQNSIPKAFILNSAREQPPGNTLPLGCVEMLHSKLSVSPQLVKAFPVSQEGAFGGTCHMDAGGWGWRDLLTGEGVLQLKTLLSLIAWKLPREKIASDNGFGCGTEDLSGIFRHKIWGEQIQSSVKHPGANVPSALCSYTPPGENLQARKEGIHILWGLTPGIWLYISPVCFVCVPLQPPSLTCAPQRDCEFTLLPVSLVLSSAIKLNLHKGMSDWRDAFINCVELCWLLRPSRSPLKDLQTGAFQMVWIRGMAKQMGKKCF